MQGFEAIKYKSKLILQYVHNLEYTATFAPLVSRWVGAIGPQIDRDAAPTAPCLLTGISFDASHPHAARPRGTRTSTTLPFPPPLPPSAPRPHQANMGLELRSNNEWASVVQGPESVSRGSVVVAVNGKSVLLRTSHEPGTAECNPLSRGSF